MDESHLWGMRLVHAHLPVVVIVRIKDGDLAGLLQEQDFKVPKNVGHGLLETLAVRVWKSQAGQGDFAALLDDLRRLRLQNWIV